jgi:hypothetical protein
MYLATCIKQEAIKLIEGFSIFAKFRSLITLKINNTFLSKRFL